MANKTVAPASRTITLSATNLEERVEHALGALVQHFPETKQEAAKMTAQQWASFQSAVDKCNTLFEEIGGSIRHNGKWIHVGRMAAESVNNAATSHPTV